MISLEYTVMVRIKKSSKNSGGSPKDRKIRLKVVSGIRARQFEHQNNDSNKM
jgi:hypothetical protein